METINQSLIEQIVREVVKRLFRKHSLLLVYNENAKLEEIEMIQKVLQQHWQVITANMSEPFNRDIQAIEYVYFYDVDQDFIVRGALGLTDTQESDLLANALQSNISVYIQVSSSLRWMINRDDQSEELSKYIKRYQQHLIMYLKTLQSFGVTFGTLENLPNIKPSTSNDHSIWTYKSNLLTQREVERTKAKTIAVSPATIITPLAYDTAKDRGISICVNKDEVF